ncbi:helix-turn-helix transcriptional regulator [Catellatospora sp. NPDC049111]|uniref:helix-turn-helix domain-containing protein n=1 Tax=Catellatospora sp. NPDC049111 TaxID=3155271 RepID=UPI0033FB6E77
MAQLPRPLDPDSSPQARFGATLRQLRQAAALSLARLGVEVHLHPDAIAKYEKAVRWPARSTVESIDRVLKADGVLVTLWEAVAGSSTLDSWPGIGRERYLWQSHTLSLDGSTDLATSGNPAPDPADRADDVLSHIRALARSSGLGARPAGRRRIALTDVARLTAITDLYRSVDRERGGGELYRQLAQVAEAATMWLAPGYTVCDPQARHHLARATADVRLLAGWTAFDAGMYEDSQRHFILAERAAVRAGDAMLTAKVRYCLVRQLQHRHHNVDALDTAQFARADLGSAGTPAMRAMLLGAEAASLAALGYRDQARQCLHAASDTFADIRPENEPAWMHFYDAGELYAQYGRVYRDLARQHRSQRRPVVPSADPGYGAQAVFWVNQALAGFGTGHIRSITLNRAGLFSSLMLAGDPDAALAVGTELLTSARAVCSQRVVERIVNLRRDLVAYERRSDVSAFAHMISTRIVAP